MDDHPACTDTKPRFLKNSCRRVNHLGSLLQFSWKRAGSFRDVLRLFYYGAMKPSLAYRGWAHYSLDRKVAFSIKPGAGQTFQVSVRDNGQEIGNIVEFFSPRSKIVPPGLPAFQPKVIYDLGANIGIASLYFGARYWGAKVYGFEPLARNFEICELNFRNLPGGRAFPWAVGACSGTALFNCQNDPRGGRLESSVHNPRLQTLAQIPVQVFTIGDLISQKGLEPPEFLKVDVEGAELDVLKGLGENYRSVKRLFVETHSPELKRDCLKWMEDHGFRIWPSEDEDTLWGDRF